MADKAAGCNATHIILNIGCVCLHHGYQCLFNVCTCLGVHTDDYSQIQLMASRGICLSQ